MKTLEWKDGRAVNVPEGLATTHAFATGEWCWRYASDKAQGAGFALPSADAAERACEAFMWRNGLIPLTWQSAVASCDDVTVGDYTAICSRGEAGVFWSVAKCGEPIAEGPGDKSVAETILRALIAREVEGGAK